MVKLGTVDMALRRGGARRESSDGFVRRETPEAGPTMTAKIELCVIRQNL